MLNLRSEHERNQPYMIARTLNSGLLVAEPAPDVPAAQPATFLSRLSGVLLGGKPAHAVPTYRKLFVPYGTESVIVILEVEYLGENDLKFCNIRGIQPTQDFKGCAERTVHLETVSLHTRRPARGFEPGTLLVATSRFVGDGKRVSRIIIEELRPVSLS